MSSTSSMSHNKRVYDVINLSKSCQVHVIKLRSFVNLRPLKADFSDFGCIASCSVVQPSKERCPHGIWLTTAARRSIFVVKKRVPKQQHHLVATGRVIKAPKKISLFWESMPMPMFFGGTFLNANVNANVSLGMLFNGNSNVNSFSSALSMAMSMAMSDALTQCQ